MKTPVFVSIAIVTALFLLQGCKKGDPAEKPGVHFVSPGDGATVESPVKIVMGITGMKVTPAGDVTEGTGHHHLIINGEAPGVGNVIQKNETTLHFGKGQTETELDLEPGEYTLTLQFGDGQHHSYGEQMSATIHITVK